MKIFDSTDLKMVVLGHQGENLVTRIDFDFGKWAEEYGNSGTITLAHKRHEDVEPYPCVIETSGNVASWIVQTADTAYAGEGQLVWSYSVDDKIVRTDIKTTTVYPSISATAETPEPYRAWLDRLLSIGGVYIGDEEPTSNEYRVWIRPNGEAAISSEDVGFENISVKEALDILFDGKINEPEDEGTAGQVLATDGDGGRYWKTVSGGGGGTGDYTELENKPQINGTTLAGNKTAAQLGLADLEDLEAEVRQIDALWKWTHGQRMDLEEFSKTCYETTIPSGAKYAFINKIVGRSVLASQKVQNGDFSSQTGWQAIRSSVSVSNNVLTATCTAAGLFAVFSAIDVSSNFVAGRKYLAVADVKCSYNTTSIRCALNRDNITSNYKNFIVAGEFAADVWYSSVSAIITPDADKQGLRIGTTSSGAIGDTFSLRNVGVVDLTQWFGAGNEPTVTTDPRLDEVRRYLQNRPEYTESASVSGAVTEVRSYDSGGHLIMSASVPDDVQALPGYGASDGNLKNSIYTSGGRWFYRREVGVEYPTITDISDIVGNLFLSNITVGAGGRLTFVQNDGGLEIPVEYTIFTDLSEV